MIHDYYDFIKVKYDLAAADYAAYLKDKRCHKNRFLDESSDSEVSEERYEYIREMHPDLILNDDIKGEHPDEVRCCCRCGAECGGCDCTACYYTYHVCDHFEFEYDGDNNLGHFKNINWLGVEDFCICDR